MWSSGTGRQHGFASLFSGTGSGLHGRSAEGQSVIPVYPMAVSVPSPNGVGEGGGNQNYMGGTMRNTGEMTSGSMNYMGTGKGEAMASPYPVATVRINGGYNQESASMSGNYGMNENARPGQEGSAGNYGGSTMEGARNTYSNAKPVAAYGSGESGMSGERGKGTYGSNKENSYGRENNRESNTYGGEQKANNPYAGGRENGERNNPYSGGTEAEAKEGINDLVSGLVSLGSMMSTGRIIFGSTWSVAAPIILGTIFVGFL
ncbi:hypothetical protein RvY_00839-2 [Ramazzottius varieornatus]|nr:hypothetical protein RvY_00839-2 [Ramazzottius varieornatus]